MSDNEGKSFDRGSGAEACEIGASAAILSERLSSRCVGADISTAYGEKSAEALGCGDRPRQSGAGRIARQANPGKARFCQGSRIRAARFKVFSCSQPGAPAGFDEFKGFGMSAM